MSQTAERQRTYVAIDLKSFYASVECVERGLDPLRTHLVVADESRTSKTICLAVSPSLKAYGLPGRARLFEVEHKMSTVNAERRLRAPGRRLVGESYDAMELEADPRLKATLVIAKPRMSHYLACSAQIYGIYLKYASEQDIHVYSIDEVFIDVTGYLRCFGMTAHELAMTIVRDIYHTTGITATAGIGTNLYLCKVAMDIVAKHMPADKDGVRVAELDDRSYRRLLWGHRPLTDFWRVGRGYANKLERQGLMTMGDIARCSIGKASDYYNEDLLYRMFGVNAELLIDHAWGWEPCTMADIKGYEPEVHSVSSGQVLTGATVYATTRLLVREMADNLALELADRGVVTDRLGLMVGYDVGSLDPSRLDDCASPVERQIAELAAATYTGAVTSDHYGRKVPKPATGSIGLGTYTGSSSKIRESMMQLFGRIVNPLLLTRRITVTADNLCTPSQAVTARHYEQLDLFAEPAETRESCSEINAFQRSSGNDMGDDDRTGAHTRHARLNTAVDESTAHESELQQTMLDIKRKYGRNAVIKAMNLEQGATGVQRNAQIGGHAA